MFLIVCLLFLCAAEARVAAYGNPVRKEIEPVPQTCEIEVVAQCDAKCKIHCDNGLGNDGDCRPGRATFANDDNGTLEGRDEGDGGARAKIRYATNDKGDNTIVTGEDVATKEVFNTQCHDKCVEEFQKVCKAGKPVEIVIERECDNRVNCRKERKTNCRKECKTKCDNGLGNGSDGCRPGQANFNNDDVVHMTVGDGGAKRKITYTNNIKGDITTDGESVTAPAIIVGRKCDDECDEESEKFCAAVACEAPVIEEKKEEVKEEPKVEEKKEEVKVEEEVKAEEQKKEEVKEEVKAEEQKKEEVKEEVKAEEKKEEVKEEIKAEEIKVEAKVEELKQEIKEEKKDEVKVEEPKPEVHVPIRKYEPRPCEPLAETDFPNIIYLVEEDEKCTQNLRVDVDILNLQVQKLTFLLTSNGVKLDELCAPEFPPEHSTTRPGETTGHSTNPETTVPPTGGETTGHSSNGETTVPPTGGETTGHSSNGETTVPPTGGETTGHSSNGETTVPPTGGETTGHSSNGETTVPPTGGETTGHSSNGETTVPPTGGETTGHSSNGDHTTGATQEQSAQGTRSASSAGGSSALLIAGVVIGSAVAAGIFAVAIGFIVAGSAASGAAPLSAAPMAACAQNPLYTPFTNEGMNAAFQ